MGFDRADYAGKPVIAVVNTWSEINPCHTHLRDRAEDVKRGVWQAGGFPLGGARRLSLSEPFMKPSTMLYRNLLAMETRGAAPLVSVRRRGAAGRLRQDHPGARHGRDLAPASRSSSSPRARCSARAGAATRWDRAPTSGSTGTSCAPETSPRPTGSRSRSAIASSPGHCMTMGTASTMTSAVEALGLTMPGAASIPAADSDHPRMAVAAGRRIVDAAGAAALARVLRERRPRRPRAGRLHQRGHPPRRDGRPSGRRPLPRRLRRVLPLRPGPREHPPVRQVPHAGLLRGRRPPRPHGPPRPARRPDRLRVVPLAGSRGRGGLRRRRHPPASRTHWCPKAASRSSAAPSRPNGAVIKHSAASDSLLTHTGPAVVFEDYPDMSARVDDPDLDVTADSVLVLRNAGPLGGPGMPEWGMLPIPKKLLKAGVRDMVRISDARMSGTAYGTCVLHVAPESFAGGPLALVQTGDTITLDVPGPPPRPERLGSRTRRAPFFLGAPRVPRHPRLRAPVREPRHPGQRGLRLRLPPRRRRSPGARDPLMDKPWDVVVVGAGILGLATARELLRRNPDTRVLVLEREPEIAYPPDGPQLRRHPRGHLLRPGLAEGPALHRRPRGPLRVLRRARDRVREAAAS